MKFRTTCPKCQRTLRGSIELAAAKVKCPSCGHRFQPSESGFSSSSNESSDQPSGGRADADTNDENRQNRDRVFGHFRLFNKIGEGGFGEVFEAKDTRQGRTVALKLPRRFDNAKLRARFLSEARIAAQLRHPSIVPVYEAGEVDGQLYIAFHFVHGSPLDDRVKQQGMEEAESIKLCHQLAVALSHAHDKGIIHRDIKPSNVLIDRSGAAQLLDLGIAKQMDAASDLTADGSLLGTPAYMSPEQASGDHANIGPRADQYSLGAVLYFMLAKRRPFEGPLHEILGKIQSRQPAPAAHEVSPTVSRDASAICAKAMSPNPEDRYATLNELADDLDRLRRNVPIQARPPSMPARLTRWARREPQIASVLALTTLILISGLLTASWLYRKAIRSADAAEGHESAAAAEQQKQVELLQLIESEVERAKEQSALSEANILARLAEEQRANQQRKLIEERRKQRLASLAVIESEQQRQKALTARIDQAAAEERWKKRLELHSSYVGSFRQALAANEGVASRAAAQCAQGLRGWEWHFARRQRLWTTQIKEEGSLLSIVFSPNGRWCAYALPVSRSEGNTIRVVSLTTGETVLEVPTHNSRVGFTPGNHLCIQTRTGRLQLLDVELGSKEPIRELPYAQAGEIVFSADGRYLGRRTIGKVQLVDLSTGEQLGEWDRYPGFRTLFLPSDVVVKSRTIVVTTRNRAVIYQIGRKARSLEFPNLKLESTAVSADENFVAFGADDSATIVLHTIGNDKSVRKTVGTAEFGANVYFGSGQLAVDTDTPTVFQVSQQRGLHTPRRVESVDSLPNGLHCYAERGEFWLDGPRRAGPFPSKPVGYSAQGTIVFQKRDATRTSAFHWNHEPNANDPNSSTRRKSLVSFLENLAFVGRDIIVTRLNHDRIRAFPIGRYEYAAPCVATDMLVSNTGAAIAKVRNGMGVRFDFWAAPTQQIPIGAGAAWFDRRMSMGQRARLTATALGAAACIEGGRLKLYRQANMNASEGAAARVESGVSTVPLLPQGITADSLTRLSISPSGNYLVMATETNVLAFQWNETKQSGSMLSLIQKQSTSLPPTAIAVSDHGDLAWGNSEGKITLIQNGRTSQLSTEVPDAITALTFPPESNRICSGHANGAVRYWESITGDRLIEIAEPGDSAVTRLRFSPNGEFLGVLQNGTITFYRGAPLRPLPQSETEK